MVICTICADESALELTFVEGSGLSDSPPPTTGLPTNEILSIAIIDIININRVDRRKIPAWTLEGK